MGGRERTREKRRRGWEIGGNTVNILEKHYPA